MKTIAMAVLLVQTAPIVTDPVPRQPSGKWTVEYADAACILSRSYGVGDQGVTVGFNPSLFGDHVEIVMIKPNMTQATYRKTKGKLIVAPTGRTVVATVETYGIKARNATVTTVNADSEADADTQLADDLRQSNSVSIEFANKSRQTFLVPGMRTAFGALRTCQADLQKAWGIDPGEHDRMKTPPKGAFGPANWINSDDYPASALSANQEGTTMMIWAVGLTGRIEDCRIVVSSKVKELDDAACKAITSRGHYSKPAMDVNGKPMIVHFSRNVVWRLPE